MPSNRRRLPSSGFPSSGVTAPVCVVAGLLAGSSRGVNALVPSSRGLALGGHMNRRVEQQRRSLSLCASDRQGLEDMDSSELYADMRQRLKELRRGNSARHNGNISSPTGGARAAGKEGSSGAGAYSGEDMKKAYYEAFWRAKNLHKEAKFGESQDDASSPGGPPQDAGLPPPPPAAALPGRQTLLSPLALGLVQTRFDTKISGAEEVATSDVQGLTQMYFLDEEDEATLATAAAAAASVGGDAIISSHEMGSCRATASAEVVAAGSGFASDVAPIAGIDAEVYETPEPQGLSQIFFLDPQAEVRAASALPVVEGRSFLREKLGVPGEVVQDLRQVELDHARLAMLAVLLSGAVGVGAGGSSSTSSMDTHAGFVALAEIARMPWLDPCVAGVILAVKALSEGDWRLGKGALAGWADQALRYASDAGAKVLRLGSGEEMRRLAIDIEVKHGRLALGAVVCAMAQQGLVTVGA